MRLSPFLVAVMAFATTLGFSPSANAQSVNNSKESQNIFKAASIDEKDGSVGVSRKSSDAEKLQVVIPTSKSTTAQNTPQIPPPNNFPEDSEEPEPELTPTDVPSTQPQIPPTENNQAPVQPRINPSEQQQQPQQPQQFQAPGTQQQQQQQFQAP
ncbi:MAG: hypothetical protein WBA07_17680, partial [Rivularia sp. (in: cyanobacteria)]